MAEAPHDVMKFAMSIVITEEYINVLSCTLVGYRAIGTANTLPADIDSQNTLEPYAASYLLRYPDIVP